MRRTLIGFLIFAIVLDAIVSLMWWTWAKADQPEPWNPDAANCIRMELSCDRIAESVQDS